MRAAELIEFSDGSVVAVVGRSWTDEDLRAFVESGENDAAMWTCRGAVSVVTPHEAHHMAQKMAKDGSA